MGKLEDHNLAQTKIVELGKELKAMGFAVILMADNRFQDTDGRRTAAFIDGIHDDVINMVLALDTSIPVVTECAAIKALEMLAKSCIPGCEGDCNNCKIKPKEEGTTN